MKNENRFENNELRMEIIDGILYTYYKAGTRLRLEDVKQLVRLRLEMLNGRTIPSIVFDEGIISMEKAARDYFISAEGVEGITATAFIQNTFFSKMLFRFILRAENSVIPLTTFRELKDAREWLHKIGFATASKNKPVLANSFSKNGGNGRNKRLKPAA